jgi:hypothetical protein
VQPESLKFFVAYSTTRTATSARERERDEELAQAIRTTAAVKVEMTCTYGFDKNQAAALVLDASPTAAGAGAGAGGAGAGSGAGAGAGVGVGVVAAGAGTDGRADGKNVWKWNEPPTSPLMRHQTRRSEDMRGAPPPPPPPPSGRGHKRERSLPDLPMQQAEERAITIASIERRGFPHRPKEKPGQKNLPDGLWKGALNLHWWMIPSMHWAGLNVNVSYVHLLFLKGVRGPITDFGFAVSYHRYCSV